MLPKAETSHRSPPASSSADLDAVPAAQSPPLSFAFARDHQVVLDGDQLTLGPAATMVGLREAQRCAAAQDRGQTLTVVRESQAVFETVLAQIYQENGRAAEGDDLLFDLEGAGKTGPRDLLEDAEDAPVIQLVNQLLRRAVQAGASDLHVEPHDGGLRVRMRIDGFLREVMDRSDVPVRRVVSRLKVMAGLDIAETRLPQDGRIPLSFGGRVIDTRVSSLPGHYGERVVLRILDRTAGLMPLAALGLSEDQEALLNRLSALPNGIILATGPTGSGKTTTLYSLLQLANRSERNIVTVEDPIEYDLPGIGQSQVNPEIGMTFAAGLRATLRQDPDVILVGEIRDSETASVAGQAAMTGHLVFSSLHANGSVGAVVRLRDLGVEDYLIAATLRGVIAQRLLRRLCPECRRSQAPTDEEAAQFVRHGLSVPEQINVAVGCASCDGAGYAGRVGIFEMVDVGDALRAAIDAGASEAALKEVALRETETLAGQGLMQVARGETSLHEVQRVVGDIM
ncbi:MAG: type II secretion system protein GspE [Rhodobacteraceae bacterium]|nr:type II secretion system protein GspE [Paracoccaceae bacterium]